VFGLTDFTLGVIEKGLDAASLKQKVINHNIANINTPGYKRYNVDFQKELTQAIKKEKGSLKKTDPRHLPQSVLSSMPQVERNELTYLRQDQSNVDLDQEMVELAKNSLFYNSLAQLASQRMKTWGMVISGRRV